MAAIRNIKYSMPRGDSRTFPIAVPVATYSVGASLFFALKLVVDDDADDSTAVLRKQLTDTAITSIDATDVHYLMVLDPVDTDQIVPKIYRAELEFVSLDKSIVITFPDPAIAIWNFEITGDINRRTT